MAVRNYSSIRFLFSLPLSLYHSRYHCSFSLNFIVSLSAFIKISLLALTPSVGTNIKLLWLTFIGGVWTFIKSADTDWVKLLSQIFYACTLIFQLILKCGCFDEALERFIISCVAVEEFDLWCSLELAQLDPTDSSQTRHRLLKMRPTRAMTLKESHALVSLMQVAVAQVGE